MDTLSWLDITLRLSFAFVLGSATAISHKWYQTKQFIQLNTQMALGAAMFSILFSVTSESKFSSQLILGIGLICIAVAWQKQNSQNIHPNTITRLWCAGAIGSTVGFGYFICAYIGIGVIILSNLLFATPEIQYASNFKKKLISDSKLDLKIKSIPEEKSVVPQENRYRCKVSCLPIYETDVLALLVQLGKEQKLTPASIRSQNLLNELTEKETQIIEIEVDFVVDKAVSLLDLQKISTSLKSELEVISASWIHLPSSRLAFL